MSSSSNNTARRSAEVHHKSDELPGTTPNRELVQLRSEKVLAQLREERRVALENSELAMQGWSGL